MYRLLVSNGVNVPVTWNSGAASTAVVGYSPATTATQHELVLKAISVGNTYATFLFPARASIRTDPLGPCDLRRRLRHIQNLRRPHHTPVSAAPLVSRSSESLGSRSTNRLCPEMPRFRGDWVKRIVKDSGDHRRRQQAAEGALRRQKFAAARSPPSFQLPWSFTLQPSVILEIKSVG